MSHDPQSLQNTFSVLHTPAAIPNNTSNVSLYGSKTVGGKKTKRRLSKKRRGKLTRKSRRRRG